MKFYVYLSNKVIAEVEGVEAGYEAYRHAEAIADMVGECASLVDGETGEILADNWDEDEESDPLEPFDDYCECGFDPYGGCYTFDC